MKLRFKQFISMMLCVMILFGTIPVTAMAAIDEPLTGETGSGWSEVVTPPGESDDATVPGDSSSSEEVETPPSDTVSDPTVPPQDSGKPQDEVIDPEKPAEPTVPPVSPELHDSWLQEYQKLMASWPTYNARSRAAGTPNVPSTVNLTWVGTHITFANTAYIGSPISKIYFNGEVAFCGEWNGQQPSGNYHEIASGNDDMIKQYLANYDKSSKGKGEYIATQILIWTRTMGTTVSDWGDTPATAVYDEIQNGTNDYSALRYQYKEFGGGTQNLITYNIEEDPDIPDIPDYPEDKYRIEVKTDVVTETEVRNQKTYEYSDAIGQITIRKHDQDGMSLDGALFNIDVAFSDGSHTTVNNWEVDNGARLFTWTHPQDNHDPATVTVTEVTPPRYYEGDPTPKTAVVHPTYTRVTHVETWTVTITTENTVTTVVEIESGKVVAESESASSAEVSSDPQVEEFADFVEGDRETTVTFVNRRITGDIEIIKKDANTGAPLAGATIHLWGEDLNEAGQKIDMTEVTGADGIAYFRDLPPGTYVIQETQAPHGYNLNDELQTVALQSGQVIRKEVRNYRKDGLVIKKVDPDGKPIAGAVFELRRGSGEVLMSETTDENGTIFRDYLVEGLYVIEEKKAPEGYLLDENPIKEIFIYESDDNKEYTVTFVNKKKPAIEITKIDAETPTLKLEGAVFRITDTATNNYWDIKTGADGTALLESLEIGTTYIVEELEPPAGYLSSGYRQEIVLKESRTHTLTVANSKMPALKIIKKDKVTGAFLEGATFRVSWNSGADYRDVTTGKDGKATLTDLKNGWYSVVETNAPEGYLLDATPHQVLLEAGKSGLIELFNVVQLLSGAKKDLGTFTTGENGTFYIPDLAPGDYIITEIKAAEGYISDTTPKSIHVEGGKLNTVEFYNIPYSDLRLVKIDAERRAPLEGAIFKLFDEKRLEIGTYTTTAQGEIVVRKLPSGNYFLQEVKAPAGYLLDNTVRPIELIPGKTTTVEIKNVTLGSLRIIKVDADTGKPLYGAAFLLYDVKDNLLGEYTTDQTGSISFNKNLKDGKYKIKGIKAPDGYVLDTTVRTVTIKEGTTTEVEVKNTPIRGKIQIIKKAADYNDITKDKKGALLEDAVLRFLTAKMLL